MKKKLMSLGLVVALSAAVLSGCTKAGADGLQGNQPGSVSESKENYVDGTYLLKTEVSEHDDLALVTLEVKEGKISNYQYAEYLVDSGETKSKDNYGYLEGIKAVEDLNEQFNQKKNLKDIDYDATSGATYTKGKFQDTTEQILEMAKKGETYEPVYRDGVYEAVGDEPVYGWQPEVKVIIVEGQIVGINYVEKAVVDGDNVKVGDIKSEDNYEYVKGLEVAKTVEKMIIDNNGTDGLELDGVTGATSTRGSVVSLVEKALDSAK